MGKSRMTNRAMCRMPNRANSEKGLTTTREYDDSMAIVLMGVTGSGKSSFISLLTDEPAEVGHSLQSCQ